MRSNTEAWIEEVFERLRSYHKSDLTRETAKSEAGESACPPCPLTHSDSATLLGGNHSITEVIKRSRRGGISPCQRAPQHSALTGPHMAGGLGGGDLKVPSHKCPTGSLLIKFSSCERRRWLLVKERDYFIQCRLDREGEFDVKIKHTVCYWYEMSHREAFTCKNNIKTFVIFKNLKTLTLPRNLL